MQKRIKHTVFIALTISFGFTAAEERAQVICTYAPSQSAKVAAIAGGATGGAAATGAAIAAATGLTAVAHSSGAYILTGSAGYIAGTMGSTGAALAAAPFVVGAGILVGGAAMTVELVCAKQNHPEQVVRIQAAAQEFEQRFQHSVSQTKAQAAAIRASVTPMAGSAAAKVKSISGDVWRYAFLSK